MCKHTARAEIHPMAYWLRWGGDAPPMIAVQARIDTFKSTQVVEPVPEEESDPWSDNSKHHGQTPSVAVFSENDFVGSPEPMSSTNFQAVSTTVPSTSPLPAQIAKPFGKPNVVNLPPPVKPVQLVTNNTVENLRLPVSANFRIYHLTAYGPLSMALDQRFESQGLDLELVEDIDETKELLRALPADLAIVDAEFGLLSLGDLWRKAKFDAHVTVHALMTSVILRTTGTASLQIDAQGNPKHRESA